MGLFISRTPNAKPPDGDEGDTSWTGQKNHNIIPYQLLLIPDYRHSLFNWTPAFFSTDWYDIGAVYHNAKKPCSFGSSTTTFSIPSNSTGKPICNRHNEQHFQILLRNAPPILGGPYNNGTYKESHDSSNGQNGSAAGKPQKWLLTAIWSVHFVYSFNF